MSKIGLMAVIVEYIHRERLQLAFTAARERSLARNLAFPSWGIDDNVSYRSNSKLNSVCNTLAKAVR